MGLAHEASEVSTSLDMSLFGFSFICTLTGIAGPRGRPGKPGMNGNHGIPGVQAWGVTINGTRSSELLIPPKIVGLFL